MRSIVAVAFVVICVAACAVPPPADVQTTAQPRAMKPWGYGGMAVAANPYAVDAAARVLKAGGHAVDAAIAAHAVLGLVEPQSSGLGGGGFMLVYELESGRVVAYDGRETAPAAATPDLFRVNGNELGFVEAWQSGLSVGVPGIVALYADTHAAYGRLSMAEVLAPAIQLARDGFVVSPRLADFLVQLRPVIRLDDNPETAAYFYPGGQPLATGFVRKNPAYAQTLERFVKDGVNSFYTGELAQQIVAAAGAEPLPGKLSVADLASYRVQQGEALCGLVQALRLCTMPPPSSGLTQLMILSLYDRFMAGAATAAPGARWAAFVDAQRLAYADRDQYVGDPQFVAVPVEDLINPVYLDARAGQRPQPGVAPEPGDPGAVLRGQPLAGLWYRDSTRPLPGTSHLSIVDQQGNAVSMTATVESPFGSSRWAGGFLLNNQLTDFARDPGTPATAPANGVQAGKRPRSSMAPTMVFDADGSLRMVTGSPGGNSIVAYVAKTLVGVLRWDLSAQDAIDLPNVIARGQTVRVETGVPDGRRVAQLLGALGYEVEEREGENSGLHLIVVRNGRLEGAADPRREGRVTRVPVNPD